MGNFLRKKSLPIRFYLHTLLCLPLYLISYAATPAEINEYQMKALYLYNFTKFIAWPNTVFASADAPFQICVMGNDPFDGELEVTVQKGMVKNRGLEVRYLAKIQEINGCHILFVSHSEEARLTAILAYIKQKSNILTVSEIEDFVTRGGMIQFYMLDSKVRFSINPQTLIEAGLKASSQLLQLAEVVRRRENSTTAEEFQ